MEHWCKEDLFIVTNNGSNVIKTVNEERKETNCKK